MIPEDAKKAFDEIWAKREKIKLTDIAVRKQFTSIKCNTWVIVIHRMEMVETYPNFSIDEKTLMPIRYWLPSKYQVRAFLDGVEE